MKIRRHFLNQPIVIELSDDELYDAHREYCIYSYIHDVKLFIETHLSINDNIERSHLKVMAELFYEEKMERDYTDIYAMAMVVIPYLSDELEIDCQYNPNDFIDSDVELYCI